MLKLLEKLMMLTATAIFAIAGCRQQMADQPHQRPLEPSNFFDDGMASRPVGRARLGRAGEERNGPRLNRKAEGRRVDIFPFEVTWKRWRAARNAMKSFARRVTTGSAPAR